MVAKGSYLSLCGTAALKQNPSIVCPALLQDLACSSLQSCIAGLVLQANITRCHCNSERQLYQPVWESSTEAKSKAL